MDRIQHATASQTRPAYTPTGTKGYATDFDPNTSTPATVNLPEQYNSIQETLMNTIEAAELTGDHADDSLLTKAITKLTNVDSIVGQVTTNKNNIQTLNNGFVCNKSQTGYTKLPNGLILQWGRADSKQINFPITFPSQVTHVSITAIMGNALVERDQYSYDHIGTLSNTGFSGNWASSYYQTKLWFAIGY